MFKTLGIFLFSLMVYFNSSGQSKQWAKHYFVAGGDVLSWGKETYDKGFYIAGVDNNTTYFDIRIYKTDVNGNILWQRIISDSALSPQLGGIVCTKDGGLIITGAINNTDSTMDNFLMKINPCGRVEWCKIYDLNQYSIGGPIVELKNGNFVISSYVSIKIDTSGSYYEDWTYCTDPTGNLKWQNFNNLYANQITLDNEDNILTSGHNLLSYPAQPGVLWIHSGLNNTDSAGNVIWYSEYGLEQHIICLNAATVPMNNGYITAGAENRGGTLMSFLIKYNFGGIAQWIKLIGDTTQDELAFNIVGIDTGAFLLSSSINFNSQNGYINDLKLIKINFQGQVLNQVVFRNLGHPWSFDNITATSDEKFLIPGEEWYINGDSLLVLKFNQNLELDTFYTHDTNKYDYLCSHKINPDSVIHFFSNDTVHITVPFPDTTRRQGFLIYPNPTSGNLNIQCPGNSSATAIVYDILGRQIRQYSFVPGGLGIAEINLGPIAPGIYVFVFT